MYSFYLGIDLHLMRTYAVLMDKTGKVIDERRVPNNEFEQYLEEVVPKNTYAVLEATRNWPFMYDLLNERLARVELAHPKELKAIATAVVKDDPIDSKTLAHLARVNYLPIAYAAPKEIRDLRTYLRHRDWLVGLRTQCKNRVHAVLAGYNLVSPVSDLFGSKGRQYLAEAIEVLQPGAKKVVIDQLEVIDHLDRQIRELEDGLKLTPEQTQRVNLLKTMPGVGQLTATVILAEIGDIDRFNSPKALCNWAGLTPRVRKSDTKVRHGRISKQGSAYLRAAMTRAASVASYKSKRWHRVHQTLAPRCGKTGAKVGVARHLLTVIYFMLKRNEPYKEDYGKQPSHDR
jgi:transposase